MKMLIKVFIVVGVYLAAAFAITKVNGHLTNHYLCTQNIRIQGTIMEGIVQKKVGDFRKLGVGQAIALLENDVKLLVLAGDWPMETQVLRIILVLTLRCCE